MGIIKWSKKEPKKECCPICKEVLTEDLKDFKQVDYKGKKIWICKKHKDETVQFLLHVNN